jgi:hypothetical protein
MPPRGLADKEKLRIPQALAGHNPGAAPRQLAILTDRDLLIKLAQC